ncbi:MAG: phosphatidylglycerophosphatase A [Candidatus Neomarinimicrobiota bacterium]
MRSDRIAEWIATVGRVGRLPGAPGTWGSLAAILMWYLIPHELTAFVLVPGTVIVTILGIFTAAATERQYQIHDPSFVVIDEWAGQWLALWFLPQTITAGLLAFIFFRLFDIAKPWPINRLQKLPGGWGIMADDIAAGLVALVLTHLIHYFWL